MEGQGFGWSTCTNLDDGWRKGPWTPQEDKLLVEHVNLHGEGRWNSVSRLTGLKRSGKSCRLRWVNYLRPDLKRGKITPNEETIILELHARWGNRWSTIARSLPGRTDNEIKNYWRTHFKKGKTTKSVERGRARFLRQQQEQKQRINQIDQQYQLQQDHQQQQQLLQLQFQDTETTMKRVVPPVEAAATTSAIFEHENKQDFSYMFPMSYNNMFQASIENDNNNNNNNNGGEYSMSEESSVEEVAWGSLWNLQDAEDQVFSFY